MRSVVPVRAILVMAVAGIAVAAVAPIAGAGNAHARSVTALAARSATDPGLKVFTTAGCSACHTLAAAGAVGKVGPNLDKVKPTAALVTLRVTKGKGVMPSFKGRLSAAQVKAVAAFVSSKAGKKGVVPPATTTAPAKATPAAPAPAPATTGPEALGGDPVAGRAVFDANGCAACHTLAAAGATGTLGPSLDARKPSQGVIKSTVQSGATAGGATMPAFNLSATDLNNIAAFVYQSTH